jgi:hypothetical protein
MQVIADLKGSFLYFVSFFMGESILAFLFLDSHSFRLCGFGTGLNSF